MDEEKYLYIISLNKFRLFLVSAIFLLLFSLCFVLGITLGIRTANGKGVIAAAENQQLNAQELPSDISQLVAAGDLSIGNEPSEIIDFENNSEPSATSTGKGAPKQERISSTALLNKESSAGSAQPTPQPAPKAAVRPSSVENGEKYYIQVIATRDKLKANEVVKDLLARKYKGYLRSRPDGEATLWMVRVGLYDNKEKLFRDLAILQEKGKFYDAFAINNGTSKKISPTR